MAPIMKAVASVFRQQISEMLAPITPVINYKYPGN